LSEKQFEAVRLTSLAAELNIAKWVKAAVLYALKHGKARKRFRVGQYAQTRQRKLEMLLPDELKCTCGCTETISRTALNGMSLPGVFTGCGNCGKVSECLTAGHLFTHVDRVCTRCGIRKPFFIPYKQVHWLYPERNPPGLDKVDLGVDKQDHQTRITFTSTTRKEAVAPEVTSENTATAKGWSDVLRDIQLLRPDEANAKFRDLLGNNATPWGFSGWSEGEKIAWLERYAPLKKV
jgi:hypothetical protein